MEAKEKNNGTSGTAVFICGDSTAASYDAAETLIVGWGQALAEMFPEIPVFNHAMAGRSTRTFLEEGRLQRTDGKIRPGDLLLIQFGHNDESDKPERHTDPWTDYRDNLKVFVKFARERGAVPILLTPVCMRIWKEGKLQETHGDYPAAMRSAAEEESVPLMDMYRESFRIVSEAGEEGSKQLFMNLMPGEDPRYPQGLEDNAHPRRAGAERFAAYAAGWLREHAFLATEG